MLDGHMLGCWVVSTASCAVRLGNCASMKKAASGRVLASAVLIAHAKRVFLPFHE